MSESVKKASDTLAEAAQLYRSGRFRWSKTSLFRDRQGCVVRTPQHDVYASPLTAEAREVVEMEAASCCLLGAVKYANGPCEGQAIQLLAQYLGHTDPGSPEGEYDHLDDALHTVYRFNDSSLQEASAAAAVLEQAADAARARGL